MINHKFEEKTCGDGPNLTTMFREDENMQTLIEHITVRPSLRPQFFIDSLLFMYLLMRSSKLVCVIFALPRQQAAGYSFNRYASMCLFVC